MGWRVKSTHRGVCGLLGGWAEGGGTGVLDQICRLGVLSGVSIKVAARREGLAAYHAVVLLYPQVHRLEVKVPNG